MDLTAGAFHNKSGDCFLQFLKDFCPQVDSTYFSKHSSCPHVQALGYGFTIIRRLSHHQDLLENLERIADGIGILSNKINGHVEMMNLPPGNNVIFNTGNGALVDKISSCRGRIDDFLISMGLDMHGQSIQTRVDDPETILANGDLQTDTEVKELSRLLQLSARDNLARSSLTSVEFLEKPLLDLSILDLLESLRRKMLDNSVENSLEFESMAKCLMNKVRALNETIPPKVREINKALITVSEKLRNHLSGALATLADPTSSEDKQILDHIRKVAKSSGAFRDTDFAPPASPVPQKETA